MYNPADTIVAVSSPGNDHRIILRLTGPQTIEILNRIFTPGLPDNPGITKGIIQVTEDITLDSLVYLFRQPHSYTGDDLAEIHLWANVAITGQLLEKLLSSGARPAAPGEFTARAYLNNKIDLAQAEAVNEVITASNTFQLKAAENLLAGQFGHAIEKISSAILDLLSRLEADLDFSSEDVGSANEPEIIASIIETTSRLRRLLSGSVRCESTIDLPAVGIAGGSNAGKSTLLNKLLGRQRSIVSDKRKTTRDVLTGELTIHDCRLILFDCAGLITHAETILDELAQQAAIQALRNAVAVIFCVDVSEPDFSEDLEIRQLITSGQLILVATKTDLLSESELVERTLKLKSLFNYGFLPISAQTGIGIDKLKSEIADRIITATTGHNKEGIALTTRHRQAITAAIADLEKTVDELKADNDEVAAMMLRTAHSQLSHIEQHNVDEQILDRIFSRFCIGK